MSATNDNVSEKSLINEEKIKQLFNAVANDYFDKAKELLDGGLSANAVNDYGQPLLFWAVYYDHREITQLLIQHGANVNIRIGKYEQTPLHMAAERGDIKTVEVLLLRNDINVNVTDRKGRTPLHMAVEHDHREITQLLIQHGANVKVIHKYGQTLLHIAAERGDIKTVELLLLRNDINVNMTNSQRQTALYTVAIRGDIEMVELLLNKGANPSTTPLNAAATEEIRELLKREKYAPKKYTVDTLFRNENLNSHSFFCWLPEDSINGIKGLLTAAALEDHAPGVNP